MRLLLVVAAALAAASNVDDQWMAWLEQPPPAAVAAAALLASRADGIVSALPRSLPSPLGTADVVVSGGGNLDGFYMGVHMVLVRAMRANASTVAPVRWRGDSAGGMMPFELALKVGQLFPLLQSLLFIIYLFIYLLINVYYVL